MKRFYLVFVFIFGLCGLSFAQSEPHRVTQLERRVSTLEGKTQRVSGLEQRISTLENKIRQAGDQGLVLILFGTFCALWTQNTGRSAWLWFFPDCFSPSSWFLFFWPKTQATSIDAGDHRRRMDDEHA